MRVLACREPTFALHVHVGVPDPEDAIRLLNRLRVHLPLLLALSANSPYWQGRDTGLASARTVIFQAFPRTGIPRRCESYVDWRETTDGLIRVGAIPEPTFLWWDVRPQPRFGPISGREPFRTSGSIPGSIDWHGGIPHGRTAKDRHRRCATPKALAQASRARRRRALRGAKASQSLLK